MRKLMCCLTSVTVVVMLIGFSTGFVQAGACYLPAFSASNFSSPISNPYLSMDNIGYTYVYEAETDEGTVLDFIYFKPYPAFSEPILGLDWVVIYDVEYLFVEDLGASGTWVKLEETDDYHLWDDFGNFWYGGEDTLAFEYNETYTACTSNEEGAWKAGVDGAEPGIILLADPLPGVCVQQENLEGEAEDMGKVLRLNAKVSVEYDGDDPDGEYEGCEMTKEFTPLDPGNIEHKYYCRVDYGPEDERGRGLVYVEELKEKTVIFELVDYYAGPPVPPTPLLGLVCTPSP